MTTIKAGSQGDEVKALQQKLGTLGFSVEVDGIFGPKTGAAVEALQSMFGYDVDGVVGPATLKLVESQLGYGFNANSPEGVKIGLESQGKKLANGGLAGADLVRTLKQGLEGADVAYLQRRLVALGYALEVDAKFGPATLDAVKDLQKQFGYDVDGVVGKATHALINAQIGYGHRKG